ncbi:hypothetical protein BKA65DRAFT_544385 [Rhexocercosporidium sp. MPI-PUGE-AT-0058]|nr:hypothetical protein BKA65DRAFT_544385 [Rhexocercosporidium sp. MPI-PUGE-AT-0058]
MTRRDTGLFAGFNLENTRSLRNLHWALEYWKKGGRAIHLGALSRLSKFQRSTVEMVIQRTERSPLLEDIIMTFLKLPRENSKALQAGGITLELYAVTAAYEPKTDAYKEAEEAWNNRQPLGLPNNVDPDHKAVIDGFLEIFKLEQAADAEYLRSIGCGPNDIGGIEFGPDDSSCYDSSEDESDMGVENVPFLSHVRPVTQDKFQNFADVGIESVAPISTLSDRKQRVSLAPIQVNYDNKEKMRSGIAAVGMKTKFQSIKTSSNHRLDQVPSSYRSPYMNLGQDAPVSLLIPKDDAIQPPHKTNVIRAAKMMDGYIITNSKDVDSENAKVGLVDPSKLVMTFNTGTPDPYSEGEMIPVTRFDYVYSRTADDFDWYNAEHIRALNNWRQQVLLRHMEPRRKPRPYWLSSERKALLELAEIQLQSYGTLKWDSLANAFSRQNVGLMDGPDEKLICRGKRALPILGESRSKPWRTKASLMALCKKDSEFQALLAKFNSSYVKTTSRILKSNDSESDENPNPAPGPQPRTNSRRPANNNRSSYESVGGRKKRKRGHSDVENEMDAIPAWAASETL